MKNLNVCYVVASQIGTIGMGSTSYYALNGIEKSGLSYKAFCRGYKKDIMLDKRNLTDYSVLEYLTYPFRFLEKFCGIKINSFTLVNKLFGKLIFLNLPKSRIYHTWINISPEAIISAKKNGSILILEGANSHPLNVTKIMNKEYKIFNINEHIDLDKAKKEAEIYNAFDYVMCPSDFVYNSFLEEGFNKKKLIKIPYGVDIDKFTPAKNKAKSEKIKFIFVGSVQLRKGVQYLLQAWDELKLKNAELIVVGRVWQDALKIVEKYKLNKTIKFIGFESNPVNLLQQCNVFISPSLEEGSALTCYEAMACGLPLIATFNTGSIARNNKEGFIIPIRSIKALKEKINYLYNNPKQIEKMGKAARKQVEQYTWDKYGERLAKVYKRILNENKS